MGCTTSGASMSIVHSESAQSALSGKALPRKSENSLRSIPRNMRVQGNMADDIGKDCYRSMISTPGCEIAGRLGFQEPPNHECSQAHIQKLEMFLNHLNSHPVQFAKQILEWRSQMNAPAQRQERTLENDSAFARVGSKNSVQFVPAERVPIDASGHLAQGRISTGASASQMIGQNDDQAVECMDFTTDDEVTKVRNMQQRGATKHGTLKHFRAPTDSKHYSNSLRASVDGVNGKHLSSATGISRKPSKGSTGISRKPSKSSTGCSDVGLSDVSTTDSPRLEVSADSVIV